MNQLHKDSSRPGIHAFIVGVSAYSRLPAGNEGASPALLGLRQLRSPALTAFRMADWLVKNRANLALPLASCRLLVAPSQAELEEEPRIKALDLGCTFDNFLAGADAWRQDVGSHTENIAIFYFAGHGAQRSQRSHVLLLQDFGSPGAVFGKAVDTQLLIDGMAQSDDFPQMGLRQIYFIDACRVRPNYVRKYDETPVSPVWDKPGSDYEGRSISIFYAAAAGRTAYSRIGKQTIFSEALLQCLNGDAATPPTPGRLSWQVTVHSLADVLEEQVKLMSAAIKRVQRCVVERLGSDIPLHVLQHPPMVPISFAVNPADASELAALQLADADDVPVEIIREGQRTTRVDPPVTPHPFPATLRAGLYQVRATLAPPFFSRSRLFDVTPRGSPTVTINVG